MCARHWHQVGVISQNTPDEGGGTHLLKLKAESWLFSLCLGALFGCHSANLCTGKANEKRLSSVKDRKLGRQETDMANRIKKE